jgi:hypothetical protein
VFAYTLTWSAFEALHKITLMIYTCADWTGGFHSHSDHHQHLHKCHNPHRHRRRRRRYRRCHDGDDDYDDDDDDDVPAVVLSRGRPLQLRLLKPPPVVAVAFVRPTALGDGDVRCRRTAKWRRSEECLQPRPLLLLPCPRRSLRGCPYWRTEEFSIPS